MSVQLAVVIPAGGERGDNLPLLLEDVARQSLAAAEVEVVCGVAPNGRARQTGAEATSSEFLIFLDDDVRLGSPEVFARLIGALQSDSRLGLVGTAQQLPADSTSFQRACARQIARSESPIVTKLTPSDMVTTQCCAMRRAVLEEVGGFHTQIRRGVDPELRQRVRRAGYDIAVVPHAWHYHPAPSSFSALWRLAFRDGDASAFAQRHYPETVFYNPEGHVDQFEARPPLWKRLGWRVLGFLRRLFRGELQGLTYDLAYLLGYTRARFTRTAAP